MQRGHATNAHNAEHMLLVQVDIHVYLLSQRHGCHL